MMTGWNGADDRNPAMTGWNGDDRIDVRAGVDTDLDGTPDTLLVPHPDDLVLAADTDHDGLADVIIRIGPDGVASTTSVANTAGDVGRELSADWSPTDPNADACYEALTDRW